MRNNFAKVSGNGQKSYGSQNDNFKASNKFKPRKGPVGGCFNCVKDHYANHCPLNKMIVVNNIGYTLRWLTDKLKSKLRL
ncbi:hypothetical protein KI387_013241 [Taxus chinensis]|uniref:Uncharacterized protein n=1 Tax=Taxus chinensis TaxID=29808 RepID=A0AA38FGJ6_TAXCH|nr:hypothetical protein KI387_013241 [Taxus chinensis]